MTFTERTSSIGSSRTGGLNEYSRHAATGLHEVEQVRWAWGAAAQPSAAAGATGVDVGSSRGTSVAAGTAPAKPGAAAAAAAAATPRRTAVSVKQRDALLGSDVRGELVDLMRALGSNAIAVQTDAPSMTRTLRSVQLEGTGDKRSIGLQCGPNQLQSNASTQVTESEVLKSMHSAADDEVNARLYGLLDEPDADAAAFAAAQAQQRAVGAHSRHLTHTDVRAEDYPNFLQEARAMGICNRYGYISLPRPAYQLPPRRTVKAVEPVQVPHLYGSHDLHIDDAVAGRLQRMLHLWTSHSGFVPKF
jgi:hypothetical protein